jgi:hypothetical protein
MLIGNQDVASQILNGLEEDSVAALNEVSVLLKEFRTKVNGKQSALNSVWYLNVC